MARETDLPDLISFAKNFHQASPYRTMKFSLEKTREGYRNIIRTGGLNSVILVAHRDDKPIGMIVAMCASPVWSNDLMAMEVAWWIEPKHRGTRHSLLLLEAYEAWAKRVGCQITQLAYLEEDMKLNEFYKRRGYRRVETSFIKGVL